jgi:hypothetical protein
MQAAMRWLAFATVMVVLSVVPTAAAADSSLGCSADTTRALIRTFVSDLNTGRLEAIDRLWAPAPRFQWYSTGAPGRRTGPKAKVRATLIPYLRGRAEMHERIKIVHLGAGYDPARRLVNFGGKLVRSAADMTPRQRSILHDFKGAAECISGRPLLIVWSR